MHIEIPENQRAAHLSAEMTSSILTALKVQ
jgi:hypothetical protein